MTTAALHRHLAQGTRAFQVTTYTADGMRLGSHPRLTYAQARWEAQANNVTERHGWVYVVEATRTEQRMNAMAAVAGVRA